MPPTQPPSLGAATIPISIQLHCDVSIAFIGFCNFLFLMLFFKRLNVKPQK